MQNENWNISYDFFHVTFIKAWTLNLNLTSSNFNFIKLKINHKSKKHSSHDRLKNIWETRNYVFQILVYKIVR